MQQIDDAPPAAARLGPSRRTLAGASGGAALVAIVAVLALTLGGSTHHAAAHTGATAVRKGAASAAAQAGTGHVSPASASPGTAGAPAGAAPAAGTVPKGEVASTKPAAEVRDPEEAKSFPVSPSVHHAAAARPTQVAEEFVAPGAQSNAEIRQELGRMHAVERAARAQATAVTTTVPGGDSVGGNGQIPIPAGIPEVVQRVIAGANAITDFPYVYGGGHASFVSNSYDCSGSVSYALAAGGLLGAPETSGTLESFGEPGPGKWITIYANAGHVYMYVNIGGRWMRFDTVGRSGPYASRWQPEIRSNEGFVARHPAGF
jgi:cell wall-associated NlpC family hydrolase